MNEVGKYFYNNGGAYLTFGVHDHMVLPTAIKLVDRNNTPDGWTLGETTAMTGTSEEGWKISFHGSRFEGYGTSYAADIDITKLQAGFNLSELTSGKSVMLQFGNVSEVAFRIRE